MVITPFQIAVPDAAIADLHMRLDRVRWSAAQDDQSWASGTSVAFLQRLVDRWRTGFDWRQAEVGMNRLPQFMARLEGVDIHFVHRKGVGPDPLPLILTHGWPGSFMEMEQVIPLLTDPAAHGGDPADAFDVVVPSLPGYGFSSAPLAEGMNTQAIAKLWRALMAELGYDRFAAQGGDIGAGVSTWLAQLYPKTVIGIHLNYIPGSFRPLLEDNQKLTAEEQGFLDRAAAWSAQEGAYAALQSTKPQTLAFGLSDSPVALAAWMAEKFHGWSDCDGDVETAIPMDDLIRNIAIYWFSGNINASLDLYRQNRAHPLTFAPGERITPPLGVALFPHELPTPPRSWVERVFDVQRWTPMPRGGHFAAVEQPDLLVDDIRAFFRPLRRV
ncbi:epoxide hydrolase family protein [Paracoccus liaowanqingii]|uniref:epoxide hydrolase family protein n=1 Tax=Paracoccus liaowanqingii TaxID=2560053 RepID=UPI00159BDE78|nr:epoxide hydrolase family protein [Paracoccus liaowanqingii]